MKLSELLKEVYDSNIQVDDPEIYVQLPPGTKCWEASWSQFAIGCVSDDGGTLYLQCEPNKYIK